MARKPTPSAPRLPLHGLAQAWRDLASGSVVMGGMLLVSMLCSCSSADRTPTVVGPEPTLAPPEVTSPLEMAPTPAVPTGKLPAPTLNAPLEAPQLFAPPASSSSIQPNATQRCLAALQQAEVNLAAHHTASAVYRKRERLSGQLEETNVIQMKVRREPMSVYMRWQQPDEGREAIWQHNANEGMILVHPGGWKRKFVPLVKVDPHGSRAAEGSKRPISTSGPWAFNRRLIEFVGDQISGESKARVTVDEQAMMAGVACQKFTFEHSQPGPGHDFQRADIYVDRQRVLPIGLEVYTFASDGRSAPLLDEQCSFENLQLGLPLDDTDFNASNPKYDYVK